MRIIAATNRDLKALVAAGAFREDLYYRLKVVELKLPPLSARRQDIPLLVAFFLKEFSAEFRKTIDGISAEVMERFMAYPWPGNVRELRHVIEHACILCRQNTLTLADLPAVSSWVREPRSWNQTPFRRQHPLRIAMRVHRWIGTKTGRLGLKWPGVGTRT